jgi:hypothetical protein
MRRTPQFIDGTHTRSLWSRAVLRAPRLSLARALPLTLFLLLISTTAALARPSGPRALCATYPDSATCKGKVPSCLVCHSSPPTLNVLGAEIAGALYADPSYTFDDESYEALVPLALASVEGNDPDADGTSTLEEITLGTLAGDARSVPVVVTTPTGAANPHFDVGHYDARFAQRRVMNLYCGRPATYEDVRALAGASDALAFVDDALSACLESDYWRHEGLYRLADKRIRPLEAVGYDGIIPLADYAWDYRLFSHVLTGDRDARDLLLATYHVDEDGNVITGAVPPPANSLLGTGGQPLVPERRAGMITTQWFLMIHTMFSALPRTTAAQAYRAYLGLDLSRSEGILPVSGEPRDVDQKGVQQPVCAACHSTLDPLSYAFSTYNGIGTLDETYYFEETGTYDPTRTPYGESAVLLGEEVTDLVAWANAAASSEAFQQNLARMFFTHAMGREPNSSEEDEFRAIWTALPDDGYSANALIRRIVFSNAFGVP